MEETTQTQEAPVFSNAVLYAAFSSIPLDLEGSNIAPVGWIPHESDVEHSSKEIIEELTLEYTEKNKHVLFKNVNLKWDSCDCSDGFGCSHPDWVYEIEVVSGSVRDIIDVDEAIYAHKNNNYCSIPTKEVTVYDFFRICEIVGIKLEFSDYALSLLK